MDNLDKKITNIFKNNTNTLPNNYIRTIDDTITNISMNENKIKNNLLIRKIVALLSSIIFLGSGFAFAQDIQKIINEKFSMFGKGISNIVKTNTFENNNKDSFQSEFILKSDNQEILNTDINIKTKEIFVYKELIGINLQFEFDNKVNEVVNLGKNTVYGNIDYENSDTFTFNDLLIYSDSNGILYSDKNSLKRYEKNINNNTYQKDIINSQIRNIEFVNDKIIVDVELSLHNYNEKELNNVFISLKSFTLQSKDTTNQNNILFESKNEILMQIKVPQINYDTSKINYKVKSSENSDFNVYTANAFDVGFELGLTVNNKYNPEYPTKLDEISNNKEPLNTVYTREEYVNFYGEEYVKLLENYWNSAYLIRPNGYVPWVPWITPSEGCYIINGDGQKYYIDSKNHTRTAPNTDNYVFNVVFSLNKEKATDEIEIIIDYMGKPVKIILEKEK